MSLCRIKGRKRGFAGYLTHFVVRPAITVKTRSNFGNDDLRLTVTYRRNFEQALSRELPNRAQTERLYREIDELVLFVAQE